MSERPVGSDDGEGGGALERTLPARPGATQASPEAERSRPAADPPPADLPRPGQSGLDRYRLIEEVGQGGMAVVYRGRDLLLDREVAVKVLHPHLAGQAESRDRLQREAQAVAKLRHENILEIYDYSGRGSDKSFIVTEFIHGTTLRAFTQAHAVVGGGHPEVAELIVSEIARALEAAHAAGVIHRDVKPENVMIRDDGIIKLTDFGIAQIVDRERMTVTGQLLGSPAYMAPEHVEGTGIDFRTDVFAVGILLYQLATGQLPFRGKNPHEVLKRIAECSFIPPDAVNPRVGRRLARVILRALSKEKDARYSNVGDLRRELIEDLYDAGLDEPRAELARLFADPERYASALGPRLVTSLTLRGRALRAAGRSSAALELWRRALELEPRSHELLGLVAGAERRHALRSAAGVLAALAILSGTALVGMRALRAKGPSIAIGAFHARDVVPPPAILAARSSPAASAGIDPPGRPGTRGALPPPSDEPRSRPHADRSRAASTLVTTPSLVTTPPAAPTLRRFELVPTPKAVTVSLDGKLLGEYGPELRSVELDGRPHTITFDNPYCYPESISVAADAEPGRLLGRLNWKPATLTVEAIPKNADILIDGTQVAYSGRPLPIPIPRMSDGRRTLRVTVAAPGHVSEARDVELRANDAKTLSVALHAAGAP